VHVVELEELHVVVVVALVVGRLGRVVEEESTRVELVEVQVREEVVELVVVQVREGEVRGRLPRRIPASAKLDPDHSVLHFLLLNVKVQFVFHCVFHTSQ
jgi:hypothetical protein